ncbi:hypothetical protein CTB91_04169 [Dickeya solani]|uniref:Uncharacterized protein n=1 Tax=Dickeya solani D s0432-1 TaxID=1231725 RepID=A0AAV3KAH5_9GAMM|nr:hypothetical protein CTB91_04169 [Dickeya solani]ERO57493.1 hypothetical protein A544_4084 [Dickeya solani D s0432-1]AYQ54055.1 hypothetical protein DSOL99_04167 [Dickeya solani]MBD3606405.1 hypothetical protein [Dickeya solani]NUA42036.1 hypothetical protein [Dickeya solani]
MNSIVDVVCQSDLLLSSQLLSSQFFHRDCCYHDCCHCNVAIAIGIIATIFIAVVCTFLCFSPRNASGD